MKSGQLRHHSFLAGINQSFTVSIFGMSVGKMSASPSVTFFDLGSSFGTLQKFNHQTFLMGKIMTEKVQDDAKEIDFCGHILSVVL